VGIEDVQHVGNGTVVNGGVDPVLRHGLGVVLLDDAIDVGELFHTIPQRGLVARGLSSNISVEKSACDSADDQKHNDEQ
jgi:hypothetical protein